MTRVQIMSDLHLDRQLDGGKDFIKRLDPTDVDVLVLAGDIAETHHEGYGRMVRTICEKYPQVVMTPGNHEFWQSGREKAQEVFANASAKSPNLHILQERIVTLNGTRFVGATLWFLDTAMTRMRAKRWIDFARIPGLSDWIWETREREKQFLLDNVKPGDVVVTHHLPLASSLDPRFAKRDGQLGDNAFYLNDVPEIFYRGGPALWVHGHTHRAFDYMAGDTRVVCNPLGYRFEDTGFIDKFVIEVPKGLDVPATA